ncbi:Thioredoxin [Salinibacillus kushneri]|uniref:Thioredoxin n=1 Tax=Salinibacillus kushneri TaxID=237682 RepID=A0A1I0JCY8_9BACI|nr:thioredoxin family protein [Salinibacillus kushneri]SEU07812.1 Thioredoxin [Salinibacillus kushneri]
MIELKSEQQLNTDFATGSVILLFSADWCPDCRFLEPLMPELEEKYENEFMFVYVNRDEFIDLCATYNVFGIPSFVALEDGQVVDDFVSKDRKTKEEVDEFLQGVKEKIQSSRTL